MVRQFNTDLEGPFSKDDNAFDLAVRFIQQGSDLFKKLSAYDDCLAYIDKKPGYKAGNTLGLIVPFFIAYGLTSDKLKEFSLDNVHMLLGSKETLQYIRGVMNSIIISTSYEPYVHAVCELMNFPKDCVYCTKLDIDKYRIDGEEIERLKKYVEEINRLPEIVLPENARSRKDLSEDTLRTLNRLDEIFWEEMQGTESGNIINEINPIGGFEKANAIADSLEKTGIDICNVSYCGDSITDYQAFQLVNKEGGLTISVNGNIYAVREASIGCMIDNTIVTSVLADAFNRNGTEQTKEIVENWNRAGLEQAARKGEVNGKLINKLFEIYSEKLPEVILLNNKNRKEFGERSSEYRKTVRGENVGNLG